MAMSDLNMKRGESRIIDYSFQLVILLHILWGAKVWFFGLIEDTNYPIIFRVVGFVIAVIYKETRNVKIQIQFKHIIAIVFLLIAIYLYTEENFIRRTFTTALSLFPFLVLLFDKKAYAVSLFIAKIVAIILIPSIIIHLLSFVFPIPYFIYQYPHSETYVYANYLFTLKGLIYGADTIRFFSFFLEPGYAGSFFALLLYVIGYNLKRWYTIVILLSLLLTLSLSAYILLVWGFLISNYLMNKKIHKVVVGCLIIFVLIIVGKSYNNGKNILNESIIERLEYDKEKGIKGNNRSEGATDFYFDKLSMSGDIWFGLGNEKVDMINGGNNKETIIAGSGFKRFSVTHGVLCIIFFMSFYFLLGLTTRRFNLKYVMGMLVLLLLMFLAIPLFLASSSIGLYILCVNRYNYFRLIRFNYV